MSNVTDGHNVSNVGPGSYPSPRALKGGKYAFSGVAAWGGGSAKLQTQGPDGSTWFDVGTPLTANGMQTFDLPPGQYQIVIATATGVYAALAGIPQ